MANIINNRSVHNIPATNTFGDAATNYTLIQRLQAQIYELGASDFIQVIEVKEDLPDSVNNTITLVDNVTYLFVTDVDLMGDKIECGVNNVILGYSSENCSITSTGLAVGTSMIESSNTTVIRYISFKDVDTCFEFDGGGNVMALDWTGVNTYNIPNIGTFTNFDNIVFKVCAFIDSSNLNVSDSFDSFVMTDTICTGGTGTLINFLPNTVCNRRIRIQDSPFVTYGTANGINVDPTVSIGNEQYILNSINFSNVGTGSSLTGLDYTSNKSEFSGNSGIINSAKFANYYATNNSNVTTIPSRDTPVVANIVTTFNPVSQKFAFTNNRATYTGGVQGFFKVQATCSITANSNNDQISVYIAKNGVLVNQSVVTTTSDSRNRLQNVTLFTPLELDPNDYVEIWVENNTDASNITVTSCNTLVESLTIN